MDEALAAEKFAKPVFVILAGGSAPEGVTMGHAGALIHGGKGTLASKTDALARAGAQVFSSMAGAVDAIASELAPQQARRQA